MVYNYHPLSILFGVTIALSSATFIAAAHDNVSGIVKERMDAMLVMGDTMKIIGDMFKGKSDYDIVLINESALILAKHTKNIEAQFPDTHDSRHDHMSEAQPAIWDNWDYFKTLANNLGTQALELGRLADANADEPVLRQQFTEIIKSCSACHEDYRKPTL